MDIQDVLKTLREPTYYKEKRYKKMQFQIDIPTADRLAFAIDYYGQSKSSLIRKAINYFLNDLERRLAQLDED